ncbi:MAG: alkaline shock response membrane anchor protein AmaP [Actinomycetota bacterium]|nr:alkaline shock response membrane anchor protein AmaP [Actinomycetota bacterium]
MRIFNRIVMILLLAGLVYLGIATVVYIFELGPYELEDLSNALGFGGFYEGLNGYLSNIERGNVDAFDVIVLSAIALVGLILLILELKPPTPRRVRMQRGTYITRQAVEREVSPVVEGEPEVLQSNVKVKAQRRPGAKVEVHASIRPGEDARSVQSEVQSRVQQRMAETGVPVSDLRVRANESDPRQTKTRVK